MKPLTLDYATPRGSPLGRTIAIVFLAVIAAAALSMLIIWRNVVLQDEPRRGRGHADIANLVSAVDQFEIDNGRFPTSAEGWDALVHQPPGLASWTSPYLDEVPKDQWGHDFRYICPVEGDPSKFNIISAGPDGIFGTPDDIDRQTKW